MKRFYRGIINDIRGNCAKMTEEIIEEDLEVFSVFRIHRIKPMSKRFEEERKPKRIKTIPRMKTIKTTKEMESNFKPDCKECPYRKGTYCCYRLGKTGKISLSSVKLKDCYLSLDMAKGIQHGANQTVNGTGESTTAPQHARLYDR